MKTFREFERVVRGFSSHRRIQILFILKKTPELSVDEVADELDINFRTASEHIRRLAISGLVIKRNAGNSVRHKITKRAESILKFLGTLE
jgi:predicted transcriptional regulator